MNSPYSRTATEVAQCGEPSPAAINHRFELLGDRLNGLDAALAVLLGRIEPVLTPAQTCNGSNQGSTPAPIESEFGARLSNFCDYLEQMTNRVQDAISRLAL